MDEELNFLNKLTTWKNCLGDSFKYSNVRCYIHLSEFLDDFLLATMKYEACGYASYEL